MAPKSKTSAANGVPKKPESETPSSTATPPVSITEVQEYNPAAYGPGKPDKAVYDAEQNKIRDEIDAVQVQLNAVKSKLSPNQKGGIHNDRRQALRVELESIRDQQSAGKQSRGKTREQYQAIQDRIQQRIKDLKAAQAKIPHGIKTVAEADEHVRQLEKQVESATLKLVEEKRALQEISQWRRNRRIIEGFQVEQDSIDADRAKAEELRKELDDPAAKAASERYDAIKAELDELKKEGDATHAIRSKLLDERTALQGQLDDLYNRKRESVARFKEANDKFYSKLNEDRARRAERQRAQRAEQEEAKKKELVDRIREEAEVPAFQAQIEDCQTLVDNFSGKSSVATLSSQKPLAEKSDLAGVGVPELDIRKVDAPGEGLVARKKKGEEEEAYFVGGGKKKGKKGGVKPATPTPESNGSDSAASGQLQVPFATLSALLSLSIPPPTSQADVPRVIEDLKTKKAWFQANQARATAANKAKAEAEIHKLLGGKPVEVPASLDIPPNGGAEQPPEPAPTPAAAPVPSLGVPTEAVDDELETVQEQAADVDAS